MTQETVLLSRAELDAYRVRQMEEAAMLATGECVACKRTNVPLAPVTSGNQRLLVCVNPKDCQSHWPKEDRRQ